MPLHRRRVRPQPFTHMKRLTHLRRLWAAANPSRADLDVLVAAVRGARPVPGGSRPLDGKHIAVLCPAGPSASAEAVAAAAEPLGARVSRLDSGALGGPEEIARTGALLERLYDALVCDGLDAATLRALDRAADIPVFDALGAPGHPTWRAAELMAEDDAGGSGAVLAPRHAAHRAVVQTLLLEALA